MRIQILGGGPGGLYAAILLKLREPSHDIHVIERNAPDDTFGWGVVFSDETLGNLEEADPVVYGRITESFAYWDSIDIHYRDACVRSGGHGFCGMSRKRLLQILQERARDLGVELTFRTEVEDLERLKAESDLVICADGVNSKARALWADHFEPSVEPRKSPYIWFGSPASFEAFTFSFRDNDHGIFQIHAYQFEAETSTVIVETDEETWKRAGLDTASTEESIAYCEQLFAAELGGAPLLANRSSWIRFQTVKCARWHFENVVLLGDAAHTAHFSVGSGTKLAMEDSIALADALGAHADLEAALDAYEADRGEWVGRTQKAAQQSLEWFEDVGRYWHFEPIPFAFSLLTRSRRITHENLRLRDEAFVEQADRWYLEHVGQPTPPEGVKPRSPMFTPFALRDMQLDNRVVVSPMCQYSAVDGVPSDWHMVHIGSRAIGGAGLVFAEMTNVAPEARISPGCTGLWNETQRDAWKRIVDFTHANSRARIAMQLGHAGRKGSTKLLWEGMDEPLEQGNWEIVGPSPIPYGPRSQTPRPMTRADMDRVCEQFVRATKLAEEAGFDLLEIHFAHGYLLSSFLTPVSNQRDDGYGGSLHNRMRFPLEVFDACRAVWPKDRPVSVRISATDWVEGGFDSDDSLVVAAALKERGCDIIDVSSGQTTPDAQPIYGRCYQTPFADRIRNVVGIPTLTVGNITSHDQVNTILLAGRADLVALARPHLRDPYFTLRAAEELEEHGVTYPPQYQAAKPRRR